MYWNDSSYTRVYTPAIGDRIYYQDNTGAGYGDHSAVIEIIGSSTPMTMQVRSKWGYYPLYRHKASYCPYYNAATTTLRYYRPSY